MNDKIAIILCFFFYSGPYVVDVVIMVVVVGVKRGRRDLTFHGCCLSTKAADHFPVLLHFRWERGEDHQSCPLCRQKVKDKGEQWVLMSERPPASEVEKEVGLLGPRVTPVLVSPSLSVSVSAGLSAGLYVSL